eukprot:CAMPEP_0195538432 /NCGR_PEP_ID=MMETSP0794_2-20130614/49523_1 /TAXON_ID=515487 /ORGANISM="Stephanopyxis turris, Strain CCMP 815" /LENGTH=186 /DNA_ID=CAMNT_0040672411 /DNA_START=564 /DNA_END=1124 /DNA_ORIENTATION=+
MTAQSFDSSSVVQQILQGPGANKVLVVDGGGSRQSAIFDSELASLAQRNGWAGVVINGCVRGADSLSRVSIGVKAIGTHPRKGQQMSQGMNGASLTFGGVSFTPGCWIYADKDGIIVSDRQLSTGATPSYGTGAIPSYGTGATPSYGTGTTPSYGTGTTPSYGTGTTPSYGTGTTTSLAGRFGLGG